MGEVLPFRRNPPLQERKAAPSSRRVFGIPVSIVFIGGVIGAVVLLRPLIDPAPTALTAPVSVIDGDSLRTGTETIRLLDVDAPELHQNCRDEQGREWPCGRAARKRLAELTGKGDVACASQGRDRFGRTLATCPRRARSGVRGGGGSVLWAKRFRHVCELRQFCRGWSSRQARGRSKVPRHRPRLARRASSSSAA